MINDYSQADGYREPPTAFARWFYKNFADNPQKGAAYLFGMCGKGMLGDVGWEYLKRTGDKEYSINTFIKAAELILAEVQPYEHGRRYKENYEN